MKRFCKYLFHTILFCLLAGLNAKLLGQNLGDKVYKKQADSLIKIINAAKDDTVKVKMIYDLCQKFSYLKDYNTEYKYAMQGYNLSEKLNYVLGKFMALQWIENTTYSQSKWEQDLQICLQRAELAEKHFPLSVHDTYGGALNSCYNLGNYPKALEIVLKGMKLAEKDGDKKMIIGYLNQLGFIYANQNNIPEAKKNYLKMILVMKSLGNGKQLAGVYRTLAGLADMEGNDDLALVYLLRTDSIIGDNNYGGYVTQLKNSIAGIYLKKKQYKNALEYSLKVITISEREHHNIYERASYYITNGEIYLAMADYNKASAALNTGLKFSQEAAHKDGRGQAVVCATLERHEDMLADLGRAGDALQAEPLGLTSLSQQFT